MRKDVGKNEEFIDCPVPPTNLSLLTCYIIETEIRREEEINVLFSCKLKKKKKKSNDLSNQKLNRNNNE